MAALSLLCLLILTAVPERAASEAAAEPSTLALTFAWTPELRMSATSTRTRTRVTDERRSHSMTARYTLRTQADGDKLRIHFADPTFEMDEALRPLPATPQAQLVAQLVDLVPDYVVTKSGEFVGVHDLPAFQGRLERFMASIFPKDLDPKILTSVQKLLGTEAFLTARAAEQWNAVVGAWVGAELELGAEYAHSSKEPSPVFPEQQILMNYSFSAKRLLPCKRGGVDQSCVELEMRSVADPADTARMIESFLSNLAGKALPQTPMFRSLEVENVIRVVTEPNGLIPHSLAQTKSMRGTVLVDGKEHSVVQVDETQVSYAHP